MPDKVIEATPTPSSTERARKWLDDMGYTPSKVVLQSLALEFDRIAIEAQERIVNNLKGAERHEWWEMAEKLKAKLAAHDAEGGESE